MHQKNRENNVIASKKPEFNFTPVHYPRDEDDERYAKSFSLDQVNEINEFWEKFGVVVIRDILTEKESNDSISEIYQILEKDSDHKFDHEDLSTWDNWPTDGMPKYGQPSRPPIFTPHILANRQNPKLFQAFSMIMGSQNLLVRHDRACLFRPTKNVTYPDGTVCDAPQWKTTNNVHLDINPYLWMADDKSDSIERWKRLTYHDRINHFITENNIGHKSAMHVQGVLNFADNFDEDGGFICVPGFVHQFETWYEAAKQRLSSVKTSASISFSPGHWINKHAKRFPMRAGSLVIWDSRTPHGSAANNSSRIRSAQFLKMFLLTDILCPTALNLRTETLKDQLRKSKFQEPTLTALGKRLFGFELNYDNLLSNTTNPTNPPNPTTSQTTTGTDTPPNTTNPPLPTTSHTTTGTDTPPDSMAMDVPDEKDDSSPHESGSVQENKRVRKNRVQGNKW